MFFTSSEEEILKGKTTDVYFERTYEILKAKNINPEVKVEIFLKFFPDNYSWGVLSGIEESLRLLGTIPGISVRCLPEGTIFKSFEPVMVIEGRYMDFGIYETPLLGFLCHSSGISTKAARCKLAAGKKLIYNFGARRIHPAITPMVERSAFIGGVDGVSTIAGASITGGKPVGTMPHSLVLIVGDTVKAAEFFNEIIEKTARRISLIDTMGDEKFEAIRVSEALGNDLYGIRLDTPSSRRGNFKRIIEEVRWELDIRGFKNVKIMVSGGLDESDIMELSQVADAFGIGTSISSAKVLDFSVDIVEIEGRKIAKKGKMSGAKKIIRCNNCFQDMIVLEEEKASNYKCSNCSGNYNEVFTEAISGGKIVYDFPPAKQLREKVLEQLKILKL